jgi:hypothetical protein
MKQASLHYFKVLPKRRRGRPLKNPVPLPIFDVLPKKTNATKEVRDTDTEDSREEYGVIEKDFEVDVVEVDEVDDEVDDPKKKRPRIKWRTPVHRETLIKAMRERGVDRYYMYVPQTTIIYYQYLMTATGKLIDKLLPAYGCPLVTEPEVKFLVDAIRQRDILNCGMSRKEIIGVIQGMIGKHFNDCENHYDYLIRQKILPKLTKGGCVVTAQAIMSKRTEVTIHQQSRWHNLIDSVWEDLRRLNKNADGCQLYPSE